MLIFLKKLSVNNPLIITKLLIKLINSISNFFLFLPNTHYGNRAEDVLNCYVHCKNFNKTPVIIYVVNIFFFLESRSYLSKIKTLIKIISPPPQNNSLCNLENKLVNKQNRLIKLIFIFLVSIEFYITRFLFLFMLLIFIKNKNALPHVIKLFSIKSYNSFIFFKENKKNKILGYSTKDLTSLKSGWYFPQFKNLNEEKKYIFSKLKITDKSWYAAVHARSSFYYQEKFKSVRNIDFRDLIPTVKLIHKIGGYSVKVGADKPLKSKIDGLIDYYNFSKKKNDIDDLLIIKHSKFIICGTSGPMEVATIFNLPIVSINIPYLLMCSWFTRGSILITPKIMDLDKKKYLSLNEKIDLLKSQSYIDTLENSKKYKIYHASPKLIKDIIYKKIHFKNNNTIKNKKLNAYYKKQVRSKNFKELNDNVSEKNLIIMKQYERKRMLARISGTIYGLIY